MKDTLDLFEEYPSETSFGGGSTTSPASQPDLTDANSDTGCISPKAQGQEPAAGGGANPPVETQNYPPEWVEAIEAAMAVSGQLRACQTPSEVDACSKANREIYERLRDDPLTNVLSIHIANLAKVKRAESAGAQKVRLFPDLNDPALETAAREWPLMRGAMLQSEDRERMFYFSYAKKLEDPEWKPSAKQAAHMKRIHMGWQVIETGVVE